MSPSDKSEWNVLLVCTGNTARSLMAEAWLRRHGAPRWRALSAGSHPAPGPNPLALAVLKDRGYDTTGLEPKDVFSFSALNAPSVDLVITLCDRARETCPVFPAAITTVHWGLPDPAAVDGSEEERRAAFEQTLDTLSERFAKLLEIDPAAWSPRAIREHLEAPMVVAAATDA